MNGDLPRAERLLIDVPRWRGHSFIPVLEWLVCARLAVPRESTVMWRTHKKAGATGLRRTLSDRGWVVRESKDKDTRVFVGVAGEPGPQPVPATFDAVLGSRGLSFASDWGVFSEGEVDMGTRLLFDVASAVADVETVVDVGTGYGALGIGLVASGSAARAVGTEIDAVALWLASANAERAAVAMQPVLDDDPTVAGEASLYVCNFPTHATRAQADRLVASLARCAGTARVLIVVHAGLEDRYARRFSAAGANVSTAARASHAVLEIAAASD